MKYIPDKNKEYIGHLVTESEITELTKEFHRTNPPDPISFKPGKVHFYIKIDTYDPKLKPNFILSNSDYFSTDLTDQLSNSKLVIASDEIVKKRIKNYFTNNYFTFNLESYLNGYRAININILETDKKDYDSLINIPLTVKESANIDYIREIIRWGKLVVPLFILDEQPEQKKVLFFKEGDNKLLAIGPFDFTQDNKLLFNRSIRILNLSEINYDYIFDNDKVYITHDSFIKLLENLEKSKSLFNNTNSSTTVEKKTNEQSKQKDLESNTTLDNNEALVEKETRSTDENSFENNPEKLVSSNLEKSKEIITFNNNPKEKEKRLINKILLTANKENLIFNKKEILNFHTSVKNNKLILITGVNGSGKSSLSRIYAEVLNSNFLSINIDSNWNNISEFIGYYDTFHNIYIRDKNNFLDFLIEAENNPDQIFFVELKNFELINHNYIKPLFDLLIGDINELNLFSVDQPIENDINRTIKIGDNLRFIGTYTEDESFIVLPSKVIDTVNIIKLSTPDFRKELDLETFDIDDISWNFKDYSLLTNNEITFNQQLRKLLWKLYKVLDEYNLQFGLRLVKDIEKLLANLPEEFSLNDAVDLQIKQRILTKIKGSIDNLEGIFEKLEKVFDSYGVLSDFPESRNTLKFKKRNLELFDYTS